MSFKGDETEYVVASNFNALHCQQNPIQIQDFSTYFFIRTELDHGIFAADQKDNEAS